LPALPVRAGIRPAPEPLRTRHFSKLSEEELFICHVDLSTRQNQTILAGGVRGIGASRVIGRRRPISCSLSSATNFARGATRRYLDSKST
jgi:hypothetical protein